MEIQTPLDWLRDRAAQDPDRICLVLSDGEVLYGDLWRLVQERASIIGADAAPRSVVPISIRSDLPSVVEIFATSLAGAVPLPYGDERPDVDDSARSTEAILVQTSGSTGGPSIVRITSSNIDASVAASRAALHNSEVDRWLACLPLSHVGGLAVLWRTIEAGGSCVLAPFDDALPDLMRRSKPTIASLVPTMVRRLLEDDPSLLADLRLVLVGGASISRPLLDEAQRHGVVLAPTYGMTEATSQVATWFASTNRNAAEWPPAGIPLEGLEISIVSETGEVVPAGVSGRIVIDGPTVSPGYLGEPDRSAPFDTNDVGFLDSNGRLTVIGRSDDVIVSGGENVSLPSVAAAVRGFDGVADAVALGVVDEEWGTVVWAMVEGSVDVADLTAAASEALAPAQRPKRWMVVGRLPALATGKPDLVAIRRAMDV